MQISAFDQCDRIRWHGIRDRRQRVSALADHMKAVAFTQITHLKGALRQTLSPEVGHMKRIDIAAMILLVFPCTRCQRRIEYILAILSSSRKEQNAQIKDHLGQVALRSALNPHIKFDTPCHCGAEQLSPYKKRAPVSFASTQRLATKTNRAAPKQKL